MADTNKGAALLLNDAGNIDRARTTDGSIFRHRVDAIDGGRRRGQDGSGELQHRD